MSANYNHEGTEIVETQLKGIIKDLFSLQEILRGQPFDDQPNELVDGEIELCYKTDKKTKRMYEAEASVTFRKDQEIFRKQTQQMKGVLVTVSTVRVTPDLGLAKVYLSIFPSEKGKELLDNIKTNVKSIRFDLGQKVGKQLRVIPELAFYLDDSLDYLENIDRLLNKDNNEVKE